MQFLFGFDVQYRLGYFADAYMPATMQFYVQNFQSVQPNTVVDFFINARLKNARVFFKLTNLNELLGANKGYYASPYYPAMRGSFQFGVNWFLFD
jgi:hypothetical protein